MALTRFRRTLKVARLSVRELTHTLHLPPAQSELYDGPHPEWLRDVLEQLPHLQTLVVSQIPFFDHSSLRALHLSSESRQPASEDSSPTFALRLLIATQCLNTTSASLAEALVHLPNLVFLDLSNTTAARDKHVLSRLRYMSNLQVLKLRQVNLRDEDIETLADAVHTHVRSLDIRGNLLTDKSARTLLHCFILADAEDGLVRSGPRSLANAGLEDWPTGISRPDPTLLDDFRWNALDEHFIKQLAKPTVRRLPSEDLPLSGITHLYISDNLLTTNGLAKLLKSERLFVLDAGAVEATKDPGRSPSFLSSSLRESETLVSTPGVEKLVPIIEGFSTQTLTSLRIHHAIVTRKTLDEPIPRTPPLSYELSGDDTRYELNAAKPAFELTTEEPEHRYELPGDSTYFLVTPAIGKAPSSNVPESMPLPQGGGAFAPELVEKADVDENDSSILTQTGLGCMAQAVNGIPSNQDSALRLQSLNLIGIEVEPKSDISLIQARRRELRSRLQNKPHALFPGLLPNLRTLTLTDVPCNDRDHEIVDALIQFIRDCASEAELAEIETNLSRPSRADQSGPSRFVKDHSCARNIFALSQIMLEMAPSALSRITSNPFRTQISRFESRTKSSTGDADSEALWTAQENDFSFFGDEECGLPAQEGRHYPLSSMSEKIVIPTDGLDSGTSLNPSQAKKADLGTDVIQALAQFRRQRKAAYGEAVKRGETTVDGYWPGEVKIVRWHARHLHGTDYYGNHFEKGVCR